MRSGWLVFRSVWKDNMENNIFIDLYRYLFILNMVFREDDIYFSKDDIFILIVYLSINIG